MVQKHPVTAEALKQMAQFHMQHFKTSQKHMKTVKSITSSSGFSSQFGSIPICDGSDRSTYTEWVQCIKEGSYQTDYIFHTALLQRSSKDVANVIRCLPENTDHDKIIDELMCTFSGISIAAAATGDLSHMKQQPGQNIRLYINKYKFSFFTKWS